MAEQFVGKLSEFKDGDRRIVLLNRTSRSACSGRTAGSTPTATTACIRAGRPAKGLIIAKVEERILPTTRPRAGSISPRTSCTSSAPGMATNTTSGPANSSATAGCKLKKFEVVEKGDDVYVVA